VFEDLKKMKKQKNDIHIVNCLLGLHFAPVLGSYPIWTFQHWFALLTSLILLYSPLGFLPSFFEKWKTSLQELSSKGLLQKEKGDHSLG
jgi:hypothetical protein